MHSHANKPIHRQIAYQPRRRKSCPFPVWVFLSLHVCFLPHPTKEREKKLTKRKKREETTTSTRRVHVWKGLKILHEILQHRRSSQGVYMHTHTSTYTCIDGYVYGTGARVSYTGDIHHGGVFWGGRTRVPALMDSALGPLCQKRRLSERAVGST